MQRPQKLHAALLAAVLAGSCLWLSGCGNTVLTTPGNTVPVADLFPTAMLAEPIQMRAGYTHLTQPFEVKKPEQAWEVRVAFVRRDDKIPVKRFFCLVYSRKSGHRSSPLLEKMCPDDEPGIHIKWDLIRPDGTVVRGFTYDALKEDTNSQSSNTYEIGLGAFTNQAAGQYRVKVTVLRDFPELDITDPHIIIDKPFFRRR